MCTFYLQSGKEPITTKQTGDLPVLLCSTGAQYMSYIPAFPAGFVLEVGGCMVLAIGVDISLVFGLDISLMPEVENSLLLEVDTSLVLGVSISGPPLSRKAKFETMQYHSVNPLYVFPYKPYIYIIVPV